MATYPAIDVRTGPPDIIPAIVDDFRPTAIEERARSELGMIGRNETFYQVVPVRPLTYQPSARPAQRTQTAAR